MYQPLLRVLETHYENKKDQVLRLHEDDTVTEV